MLRPLLASGTLALAAFLLAPTVMSVHEGVEELNFKRDMPWELWKWGEPEQPPDIVPPMCGQQPRETYSEVTKWPESIRKNETFTMGGIVVVPADGNAGAPDIKVDLFLNETKEEPGIFLGTTYTNSAGVFTLSGRFPHDLQAQKYHLVAHAHEKRAGCIEYEEHWSDPEMEVTASTRILWDLPEYAFEGHETAIGGWLLDEVGGPVRNAEIDLVIDGVPQKVHTTDTGRFFANITPMQQGEIVLSAEFDETKYYTAARSEAKLPVLEEGVLVEDLVGDRLELVRGQPHTLRGRVFLENNATPGTMALTFGGINVTACDGCEPSARAEVTPSADGRFELPITAPGGQPLGEFAFAFSGGGLQQESRHKGHLSGTIILTLDAGARGLFDKAYTAQITAVDDAGNPVAVPIAVSGPEGWRSGTTGEDGMFGYEADADCGAHRVRAHYNGSENLRPSIAESDVGICPYFALLPPFVTALPWWGWLLILLGGVAAYVAARRLHERYATVIARGPPLSVSFSEPRDAAAGIVGVGEAAAVTAYLEEPLPDGYALRMGTYRRMERMEPGPDLRATFTLVPDELGEIALRGEITDRKGRVVSRRTVKLRVVRYAQEIERRHVELRRRTMGDGSTNVSPREFQAWLLERAPDMDPATAGRLVGIFEEADYGPRDVGRAELVAYMEAEASLPEVSNRAMA